MFRYVFLCLLLSMTETWAKPRWLQIDKAHSLVQIEVSATIDSFVGKLEDYDAKIEVDDQSSQIQSATFDFSFHKVKTGNSDRDVEMYRWEDDSTYPKVHFQLDRILAADSQGQRMAEGKLTLHGKEQTVRFPVSLTDDGQSYVINGEVKLDTTQFGLPIIRKYLMLKVDPLVKVTFHLQGKLTGEAGS